MVAQVIGDIALVIVTWSLPGAAARRCGQPAVIGQIPAGLLLGPSLQIPAAQRLANLSER
jgi:Kef-type K+ transport system membrane component KefB